MYYCTFKLYCDSMLNRPNSYPFIPTLVQQPRKFRVFPLLLVKRCYSVRESGYKMHSHQQTTINDLPLPFNYPINESLAFLKYRSVEHCIAEGQTENYGGNAWDYAVRDASRKNWKILWRPMCGDESTTRQWGDDYITCTKITPKVRKFSKHDPRYAHDGVCTADLILASA